MTKVDKRLIKSQNNNSLVNKYAFLMIDYYQNIPLNLQYVEEYLKEVEKKMWYLFQFRYSPL